MGPAADGVAATMAELGLGKGDVVCLLLPASVDYAICYLAAMRLGAITSGINTPLGPTEIAGIVARTEPRLVVGDVADVVAPSPGIAGSVEKTSLSRDRSGHQPLDGHDSMAATRWRLCGRAARLASGIGCRPGSNARGFAALVRIQVG